MLRNPYNKEAEIHIPPQKFGVRENPRLFSKFYVAKGRGF